MQRSAVSLQLQCQLLPRHGGRGQKHIPVVHVDALHRLPVHKQEKLRVLGIIPLINLGAHMEPHPLTVQLLRHTVDRLKPVMAVLAVPVHIPAVKRLPGRTVRLRVSRMEVISLLKLPLLDVKLLLYL